MAIRATTPKRRNQSKEKRREQLIKATIRCIAKRGLSGTTMADVTREAGLSLGIVNFHFQSKERLLAETLRYLAEEYKAAWEGALANGTAGTPAEKLKVLMELDFSRAVCERKKIAVWFAFWGEAKSRPTYMKICEQYDRQYVNVLSSVCRDVIAEGDYGNIDAGVVASVLSAITSGLWLDILLTPSAVDRDSARDVCFSYLRSVFHKHF